jgi:Flp pilus assembly pilin Flp
MVAGLYFLAVFIAVGMVVVGAMIVASLVWWYRHRGSRQQ